MEEASMLRSHNQNQQTNRALVQTFCVRVLLFYEFELCRLIFAFPLYVMK